MTSRRFSARADALTAWIILIVSSMLLFFIALYAALGVLVSHGVDVRIPDRYANATIAVFVGCWIVAVLYTTLVDVAVWRRIRRQREEHAGGPVWGLAVSALVVVAASPFVMTIWTESISTAYYESLR